MQLYCATGNAGKLREFRMAAGGELQIEPLPGFGGVPPCVEDGDTFAANAAIKAAYYAPLAAGLVFADDSGLVVDALDGAPGVRSARFAGEHASDAENNRLLLEKLRGAANRTARFVCAIAVEEGGRLRGIYHGAVEGVILEEPRGTGGFGYDPLFYYPPFGCTFGEAAAERKFEVSHRGGAFREMMKAIGDGRRGGGI